MNHSIRLMPHDMNLYEFEGKKMLDEYGIHVPRGIVIRKRDNSVDAYKSLGVENVVVKAQVLSGKRGKNNGIRFCGTCHEVETACKELFEMKIRNQHVAAVLIEEKIEILEERYLSVSYDTNKKQPVMVYSRYGGMNIEDVPEEKLEKQYLDIRLPVYDGTHIPLAHEVYNYFTREDARMVEINPLIKTPKGEYVAGDAKIALDDDAFYRHTARGEFEPRTMMGRPPTEREIRVQTIDKGKEYYRGTAGKYIELDGDIAILFSGGGASIANMDALIRAGGRPANYSEYSGNPSREKVYEITKVVLSKPGLRGFWIAGGVANFTNIKETFQGIIDALDEARPTYPIVVRRSGPYELEGRELLRACSQRNKLNIRIFGKEISMSESARVLMDMISLSTRS